MKRILIVLYAILITLLPHTRTLAAGYVGTAPIAGNRYYIYNVYQSKFLSYGNSWGTQVSLSNNIPLCCTLESNGNGFVINTHYSLETNGWKNDVTNYIIYSEGLPYVNARWGSSDTNYNDREATKFAIVEADEGYYLDCADGALMFGSGTACVVGNRNEGFNADKSLWRFITETEYAEMTQKNHFIVAAMNVDGMPRSVKIAGVYDLSLNPDGKEAEGATSMGQKMKTMGYDFIAASEDFNYNDEIMAQIGDIYNQGTHRGGIEVTLSTYAKYLAKETLFDTDGLNFFWKKSLGANNESWTAWNEHYGYTDNEADGLINKGYRYYLATLADGTQIDVYVLHMEAGSTTGDNAARATQLTQLANAILASSGNRPIIIMGDTNCRYTRDALKSRFIDVINADERFTIHDPWVEHGRQGIYPTGSNAIMASEYGYRKGEVVDKVFYINSTYSDIRLVAESYTQDLSFVNDNGEALADHWPCVVDFTYHTYDPAIDDVSDMGSIENVYLRNVETGDFLKAGGWWGTHAVAGNYGSAITFVQLPNGKYVLQTPMGFLSQDNPYMDTSSQNTWTLLERNGHYILAYENNGIMKALTANDPTAFPYGPNTRYVTCATLDMNDRYQMWDIVTREELMKEMLRGGEKNPYNCTFLLPGANFDRNDPSSKSTDNGGAWWCDISADASKMRYNFSDGLINHYLGNPVGEVYNDSYSRLTTYASTWEMGQTLTGLPNGRYKVTCQAFYRDGDLNQHNPGEIHSHLYLRTNNNATEVETTLASIYSAQCTTNIENALSGSTDSNGFYVPNTMTDAGLFFDYGYYNNELTIDVTDGTLSIAIGKPDKTKDTTGWTCFDNFQIYYLGSGIIGDINCDGFVTIADVTALVNIILGKDNNKPYQYNHDAADVNTDGTISIADVTALVNLILGKETT